LRNIGLATPPIDEREEKKLEKGRPYKIYSLKVGFNKIITQLETERKKADGEAQEKIELLKKLGGNDLLIV
jgi:predicted transcriptional regulator